MNGIHAVFIDLFHTLVIPEYCDTRNEYDVLGLSRKEWEKHAEDQELYTIRATGKELDPLAIVGAMVAKTGCCANEHIICEIMKLREGRFRRALTHIDPSILAVLSDLKNSGMKLCLISNADILDVLHWEESPLYGLFDEAVFSYQVGCLKPHHEIYQIGLDKMKADASRCVFIGDGGSDELKGAKETGMITVFSEHLIIREGKDKLEIERYADYCIKDFLEIHNILSGA